MLDSRILWQTLGPKKVKNPVPGENCIIKSSIIFLSPSIIRMITSRIMRWAKYVASNGEKKKA
jgi:hypothetical protein